MRAVSQPRQVGRSHSRSRVTAIVVLAVALLPATSLGSRVLAGGEGSAWAEEARADPVIALDADPPSTAVGGDIEVTGSVSGGTGTPSWSFAVPSFVQRLSQTGAVLRIECRAAGSGVVTATYTDGAGTRQAEVTVSCTAATPTPTDEPSTASAPPETSSPETPETTSPDASSPSASSSPTSTSPRPSSSPRTSSPASPSPTAAPTTTPGGEPTGTTAAPSSPEATATPDDSLREKVDQAEQQLERGAVSYRPPTSMREGRPETFVVRVQRESTPADPRDVPGEGPVVEREIEVGTPMTARLIGEDFDIEPSEAMPRVLGSTRPAEWSWTITPQSSGKKDLRLELAVLLDEDSATPIAERKYVEVIEVRVDLFHTTARLAKSAVGLLGATGLTVAALAGAAISVFRRRKGRAATAGGGPGAPGASSRDDARTTKRPPTKRAGRSRKKKR